MNINNNFSCTNCGHYQAFTIDVSVKNDKMDSNNSYLNSTKFLTGVKPNEIITTFGPTNKQKCKRCNATNKRSIEYAHIIFKNEEDMILLYQRLGYPSTNKIIQKNKVCCSSFFSTEQLEKDITFEDIIRDLNWMPRNKRIELLKYEDKITTNSVSTKALQQKISSSDDEEDLYR